MTTQKNIRILFYGTPEFAAFSLQKIAEAGFTIAGVVTAPDKPSGRGLKMQESAVKQCAERLGIEVLQPANLKSPEFAEDLKCLNPDVQVVIAFRMLPEQVWAFPPQGTFNLHASLLPQYRGAAPINHAILNGETETGVTTFFIEKEIDTGNIILQSKILISSDDTAGTLHDKLMKSGAELVVKTLRQIAEGNVKTYPQPTETNLKPAPKIFPKDCFINWEKPALEVKNFVRGLSPYPAARTAFKEKLYKIFSATVASRTSATSEASDTPNLKAGEWHIIQNRLFIGCKDQPLEILEIQQEGKKRMPVEEFLQGFRL